MSAVKLKLPDFTSVKMAGGQLVRTEKQAKIKFNFAHRKFVENFLVLSSTNSLILGDQNKALLVQNKALSNSPT